MFVLDEADEMLSRGFKEQIYDVFRKLPSSIQVVLLSATMPLEVLDVTKRFMRDPIRILVKKEELTLEGIKQFYVQVEKEVCMVVLFIHDIVTGLPFLLCRSGNWIRCVISMKLSPSLKQSYLLTPAGKWTG